MSFAKFNIKVGAIGRGSEVTVNEVDVTQNLNAFALFASASDPTILQLFTYGEGVVEGEGIVEIHRDDRKSLGEFLRQVNPKTVDERALNRSGWGDNATLTEHVIAVLLEMLDETQPGPHSTSS